MSIPKEALPYYISTTKKACIIFLALALINSLFCIGLPVFYFRQARPLIEGSHLFVYDLCVGLFFLIFGIWCAIRLVRVPISSVNLVAAFMVAVILSFFSVIGIYWVAEQWFWP